MASSYKTPGVYIEEISVFPPSVAEVATAVPAFVGYTVKTTDDLGNSLINTPKRISSLLEFTAIYGTAEKEQNMSISIEETLDADSNVVNRTLTAASGSVSRFKLYYALRHYFMNGGGPCYVVSVGASSGGSISASTLESGLQALEAEDEPTLLVVPEAVEVSSNANFKVVTDAMLKQCHDLQDRFAIMDTRTSSAAATDASTFRNDQTRSEVDYLKYGAAYYPHLKTTIGYVYDEADVSISHNVTDHLDATSAGTHDTTSLADLKSANTTLYNLAINELAKLSVTLPPSAAVAGVCCTVDNNRGVWKAPANVSLSGVIKTTVQITNAIQDGLNVDATSGKSINAIRHFTGKGMLVWGARTLAGNDNEWRYVSVRRFFNFAEESIKKGSQWVVFEPNDANTWVRVKAMIENFLIKQWRAGALAGATPKDAFFVKVGLGETMTSLDILEGRMNIEIGMAVVRPAEFIILKFSHKLQE